MTISYLTPPTRHGQIDQVSLDGTDYTLAWRWNARSGRWWFELSDATGTVTYLPIVAGFPLLRSVTGARRPPGELYVFDLAGLGREPPFAWGDDFVLIYDDDPPWRKPT